MPPLAFMGVQGLSNWGAGLYTLLDDAGKKPWESRGGKASEKKLEEQWSGRSMIGLIGVPACVLTINYQLVRR